MPGYSGTPLPKKLGLKPGLRVQLTDSPPEVLSELKAELGACEIVSDGKLPLDFAMFFTKSKAALAKEFKRMTKLLAPAGIFWVSWPKKSSGVATDLDENIVRDIGLDAGLVDVKVCAVTEVFRHLRHAEQCLALPRVSSPSER